MKRLFTSLLTLIAPLMLMAQGWPSQYGGVMLQGFYWDSYKDSKWTTLQKQADELSESFSLVWIPQSGNCNGVSMGYNPLYYWDQNSTFGSEEELRSLISTLKAKGTGTIADVVINHRQNVSSWVDFPAETYKGITYQMVSTDICSDDDGGKTKTWATQNGFSLSPNKDSGEGWDGMRDLDHASANVQTIIKAYEDYLLNDLGYTGFRYDVGKGFAAKYFALYNNAAKPQFSVGEVWDSNDVIKKWIDGTKTDGTQTYTEPQSAAFDFQFRYQVRDAINGNDWTKVAGSNCLVKLDAYKRYAVTFVENHDTEKRKNNAQDPIVRDTLAANAYLLAMPGTPCVFMTHWQAYKKEIKTMIAARKLMGINNESAYVSVSPGKTCTAIQVTGTKGKLLFAVGSGAKDYTRNGWKVLTSGYKYKYMVESDFNLTEWEAIVKHIEETTKDPEPEPFAIPSCATKQEGTYAYFEKPSNWKADINVWAWYGSGTNAYPGASWPGTVSRKDISIVGTNPETNNSVYLWKYSGTATPTMIIFNDGTFQTNDLTFQKGGYYDEDGLKGNVETSTGISPIINTPDTPADGSWYTLNGIRVSRPATKGIYLRNGKKYIVK